LSRASFNASPPRARVGSRTTRERQARHTCGNGAAVTGLPLERTRFAGVSAWFALCRGQSQRRPSAQAGGGDACGGGSRGTRRGARSGAGRRCMRTRSRGLIATPWSGRGSARENTRRELPAALLTFALRYFDREMRLRDVDRPLREPICAGWPGELSQAEAVASAGAEGSTSGRRIMRNASNNPRRPARIGTSSAT
jgi:hypothetical protein